MKRKPRSHRSRPPPEADDDLLVRVLNSHVAQETSFPDLSGEANAMLLRELEDAQCDLKTHQQAMSDLKASLSALQISTQRREEELKGVVSRAVRDLEAVAGSADAGVVVRGVVSRLALLVGGTPPLTDRTAQVSLEQCRARLEALKGDFRLLKEQKARLEADFHRQLADLRGENERLKSQLATSVAPPPDSTNSHEDWDLPLQMKCQSAAVSPAHWKDPA